MRGLDNARAEFSLTALVYNLRRALNILGVETSLQETSVAMREGQLEYSLRSPFD